MKSNQKHFIGLITILMAVVFVSGCTDSNNMQNNSADNNNQIQPGNVEYTIVTSTFQIPEEWHKVDDSPKDIAEFSIGSTADDGASLRVKEYADENAQNSEYKEYSTSGTGYAVTESKKTISGIPTKVVKTVYDDISPETITDYYFQKNGKYYRVTVDILRIDDIGNSVTDKALNTVISTIK